MLLLGTWISKPSPRWTCIATSRVRSGCRRCSTCTGGSGHPLPETTPAELSEQAQVLQPMGSLEEVLSRFTLAQGAFVDVAAAERIAFEAVEDLAADNVRLPSSGSHPSSCARRTGWTGTPRWPRSSAASSAAAGSST